MTTALVTPANLMDELDDLSSQSYIRRVMARTLGHAGLALAEAQEIWVTAGFDADLWDRYIPTVRSA